MSGQRDRLTRRDVLRGAAAAGAAVLAHPATGVAAAGRAGVFNHWVGGLAAGHARGVRAAAPFSLVGVEWSAPAAAHIELRTRLGAGAWSPWVAASVRGHGPDRAPGGRAWFGEPVWTGPADYVQLRSSGAVAAVRLHFVAPGRGLDGRATDAAGAADPAGAFPLAQPILDAGPGQPPIIARAAWARGQAPPRHVPEYGTVKLAFVHHSETPNGYRPGDVRSILMSIFAYHRYVRGFFDIAYNFAIDAFGRVWEARAGGIDEAVIGAHAGGYNAESTGVVVLGSFMAVAPPAAAIRALEHLLAWKLSLHGVPVLGRIVVEVDRSGAGYTPFAAGERVSLPRVAGHRDGDQTSCPGDALYGRLPVIRPRVARLAGTALRLSIAAPVPAVRPGTTVSVTGRLDGVGGGPMVGAPIELQQLSGAGITTTLTTLSTDSTGAWTFTLTAIQNTLLRALHRPAPAAVSDVVVISVAPVLTLNLDSLSPLHVSGTISPALGPVTIDVYQRMRLVGSQRVLAPGGRFATRV